MLKNLAFFVIVFVLVIDAALALKVDIPASQIESWIQDDTINSDDTALTKISLIYSTTSQGLIDRIKLSSDGGTIDQINNSMLRCEILIGDKNTNKTDTWNIADEILSFNQSGTGGFEARIKTPMKSSNNVNFSCQFTAQMKVREFVKRKEKAAYFKLEVDSLEDIKEVKYSIYLAPDFKDLQIPDALKSRGAYTGNWEGSTKLIFNPQGNNSRMVEEDININLKEPVEVIVDEGKYGWIPKWWPIILFIIVVIIISIIIYLKVRRGKRIGKAVEETVSSVVGVPPEKSKSGKRKRIKK